MGTVSHRHLILSGGSGLGVCLSRGKDEMCTKGLCGKLLETVSWKTEKEVG